MPSPRIDSYGLEMRQEYARCPPEVNAPREADRILTQSQVKRSQRQLIACDLLIVWWFRLRRTFLRVIICLLT
jgi:hypothetical protein